MENKMLTLSLGTLLILILASPAQAVNFYLSPEATAVNVGQVFGVDIGFNNNESVLLNGVVVTFSYDENYLQLQDTDESNMTGTGSGPDGINIMDANHFSGWNTDLDMIANLQENYMLSHPYAVHYEVMYASNIARDGIFGRAFFKALQVTPTPTDLIFGSYYGEDEGLYINPDYNPVEVTGNLGASINVVPEPNSLLLLGLSSLFLFRKIRPKN